MKKILISVVLLTGLIAVALSGTSTAPQTVEVSVLVDVGLARAWRTLQDFSVPHNYVPDLSRTQIVSEQRRGVGAHRRVFDKGGDFLEETVIQWREGAGFVLKLHEGDAPMAPFERSEFSYGLASVSQQQTAITLEMTIEMPFGGLGSILGEWFILPIMEDNLVAVAAGMKHYYERGLPASDADRARLAGAVAIGPAKAPGGTGQTSGALQ